MWGRGGGKERVQCFQQLKQSLSAFRSTPRATGKRYSHTQKQAYSTCIWASLAASTFLQPQPNNFQHTKAEMFHMASQCFPHNRAISTATAKVSTHLLAGPFLQSQLKLFLQAKALTPLETDLGVPIPTTTANAIFAGKTLTYSIRDAVMWPWVCPFLQPQLTLYLQTTADLLHRRCSDVALGLPCSLGAWHCPGATGCVVARQQSEN